eukprot:962132-Alexandrium_andersonii.AAC.1
MSHPLALEPDRLAAAARLSCHPASPGHARSPEPLQDLPGAASLSDHRALAGMPQLSLAVPVPWELR